MSRILDEMVGVIHLLLERINQEHKRPSSVGELDTLYREHVQPVLEQAESAKNKILSKQEIKLLLEIVETKCLAAQCAIVASQSGQIAANTGEIVNDLQETLTLYSKLLELYNNLEILEIMG